MTPTNLQRIRVKKYWLSPKLSWKTYKRLHDKTAPKDGGPTPVGMDRVLWEMLRDRKINIYITNKPVDGDTWFPTLKEIPRNASLLSQGD